MNDTHKMFRLKENKQIILLFRVHNWPSASRAPVKSVALLLWCPTTAQGWGALSLESFLSGSCHPEDLSWPHLCPCFSTQPHQLFIPIPAFVFSISHSLWSFPSGDKHVPHDILCSDRHSPLSSPSLPLLPTILTDPSLGHYPTPSL